MWLSALAALLQAAALPPSPPPPPPSDDWAALAPLEKSDRVSLLCREGVRITAEFRMIGNRVSVVDIAGLSHRLTPSERAAIDAAVGKLGYLDRVELNCNGPRAASIHVLGSFAEVSGRMRQKRVAIAWTHEGIAGFGGRRLPEMELAP